MYLLDEPKMRPVCVVYNQGLVLNILITSYYHLADVLLIEVGHGVAAAVERDEIF